MLRRSTLKRTGRLRSRSPKRGKVRGEWHPQVIRKDAAGMAQLRREAFDRSGGFCEGLVVSGNRVSRCMAPIDYYRYPFRFELAHIVPRGKGGSDILDNVLCKHQYGPNPCHRGGPESDHPGIQWSKP